MSIESHFISYQKLNGEGSEGTVPYAGQKNWREKKIYFLQQ